MSNMMMKPMPPGQINAPPLLEYPTIKHPDRPRIRQLAASGKPNVETGCRPFTIPMAFMLLLLTSRDGIAETIASLIG
jgi:hypothetical protein